MSTEIKPYIDEMDLDSVMLKIDESVEKHINALTLADAQDLRLVMSYKYGALQAHYQILYNYCKNKIKDLPQ